MQSTTAGTGLVEPSANGIIEGGQNGASLDEIEAPFLAGSA
jgi:hypothetical protein